MALFFWAAVYKLYPLILSGSVTPGALVQVLKDILLFRHESHFYYLHITILIYLCVPLLRVFTANASRRQLQYALLLWALCAVVYPTIKPLWPFSLLSGIPAQYAINLTWGSLGYCLLGYSLRTETAIRRWVFPVLWAGGFLLTTGSTAWASLREGALQTRYLEGMSIGVAVMAAGIFGTLCSLSPGCRGQKLLSLVSQASFTVYLSHLIFLNKLVGLLGDRAIALPLLTIPLLAFLAFACSFVLWLVLRKIPFVRRWLI